MNGCYGSRSVSRQDAGVERVRFTMKSVTGQAESCAAMITIKGVVQGVGFRPFVYKLASELSIRGWVTNTAEGVIIVAEGERLKLFIERLATHAPPLARISGIDVVPCHGTGLDTFSIRESQPDGSYTLLSPDVAICDDCSRELYDPEDRRYLYPFINCTNCGPRYSITESVPYDRKNTTMKSFSLCDQCSREYNDPMNRRFHAQPNACPSCGPHVVLLENGVRYQGDPIARARQLLKEGKIIALKGLGGFHIACDAFNEDAVRLLRERKRRSNKPFALMAADVATVRKHCSVSDKEEGVLFSTERPIVLLEKAPSGAIPEDVAPKNSFLGVMLPYTPLHHLILRYPDNLDITLLVMTSGNLSEEAILSDNETVQQKLGGIADAFLLHDRDIFTRVDDSVVRVVHDQGHFSSGQMLFLRRARGYVPGTIYLGSDGPDVLACGADLKNTFTITRGSHAIVSQHMGDMENYETLRFFEETLRNLSSVYRAAPVAVAHDLHPEYLSTKWALSHETSLPHFGIQHHHAHIASVLAEHRIDRKVIGIAFDGTGYGDDGTLWGGEFLIADLDGYVRAGRLRPMALPGGEMAVREPWRTAVSLIQDAAGENAFSLLQQCGFDTRYDTTTLENMAFLAKNRSFSPLSSGAGRLFDAVSALIGVCDRNTFEGEAPIALESLVVPGIDDHYPYDIDTGELMELDFSDMLFALIRDTGKKVDKRVVATKFHNTLSAAVVEVVRRLAPAHGIKDVACSGGVFQNLSFLSKVVRSLRSASFSVYFNESLPCNDACISLGQAHIARERIKRCGGA